MGIIILFIILCGLAFIAGYLFNKIMHNSSTTIPVTIPVTIPLINSEKPYMHPRRVLAWDDLVPFIKRGNHPRWTNSEILSDPKTKFEHIWQRVQNGRDFRYYKDQYQFDISFDAGDFGWVTLNHSTGKFTICCHKTGYRHHLPYDHEYDVRYYCEDLAKWFSDIYVKAVQEWNSDMNL